MVEKSQSANEVERLTLFGASTVASIQASRVSNNAFPRMWIDRLSPEYVAEML